MTQVLEWCIWVLLPLWDPFLTSLWLLLVVRNIRPSLWNKHISEDSAADAYLNDATEHSQWLYFKTKFPVCHTQSLAPSILFQGNFQNFWILMRKSSLVPQSYFHSNPFHMALWSLPFEIGKFVEDGIRKQGQGMDSNVFPICINFSLHFKKP